MNISTLLHLQVGFPSTRVMAPPATLTIPTPTPLVFRPRLLLTRRRSMAMVMAKPEKINSFTSYSDPCLDLFFNVKKPPAEEVEDDDCERKQKQAFLDSHYSLNHLPQLLEVAWSHDPLTTLKLIFNLNSFGFCTGKGYTEAFYTAAFWLHQNHPKTLACNLPSFSGSLGNLWEVVDILYRLLGDQGQDTAAERLHSDPDYKLLHDGVMDLFLKRLESDVDKMMQDKLQLKPSDYLTDEEDEFKEEEDDEDTTFDPHRFVTEAAACLVTKHPTASHAARAILLCESIAKRLFTPNSDQSCELEEWEKFRKLVLAPLRNYWYRQGMFDHRWSWVFEKQKLWHRQTAENTDRRRSYEVEKYLEEVKVAAARGGGGIGIIKPDALVPREIINYACYADFREAAEHQWKAMVEDIKQQQKQGKGLGNFKNCLAMCLLTDMLGNHRISALSLGLVVSELSEEPWKGMVITFGESPYELVLYSIQGDDLKSKRKFMMQTCQNFSFAVNFPEACDLILEVAVNEKLNAEHMIKKVFVFTDFASSGCHWKTKYEEVRSKFKEQGYGDDAIPQVLIWGLFDLNMPSIEEPHPGLTVLSGFSDNLGKLFLYNGGEIGPHQLMEAAIADKEYQALSVVD